MSYLCYSKLPQSLGFGVTDTKAYLRAYLAIFEFCYLCYLFLLFKILQYSIGYIGARDMCPRIPARRL
jgi:hypothetical protein